MCARCWCIWMQENRVRPLTCQHRHGLSPQHPPRTDPQELALQTCTVARHAHFCAGMLRFTYPEKHKVGGNRCVHSRTLHNALERLHLKYKLYDALTAQSPLYRAWCARACCRHAVQKELRPPFDAADEFPVPKGCVSVRHGGVKKAIVREQL